MKNNNFNYQPVAILDGDIIDDEAVEEPKRPWSCQRYKSSKLRTVVLVISNVLLLLLGVYICILYFSIKMRASTDLVDCDYFFEQEELGCLNNTTILSEESCRNASDFLGGVFVGSGSFPVPFGCISELSTDGNRMWFNSAHGYPAVHHRRQVCQTCGRSRNTPMQTSKVKMPDTSNLGLSNPITAGSSCSTFQDELTCRKSHCAWADIGCSSSCRLLQDFKFFGEGLQNHQDPNETIHSCEKKCLQDIECHGLWFWEPHRSCALFREFDYKRSEPKKQVPSMICYVQKEETLNISDPEHIKLSRTFNIDEIPFGYTPTIDGRIKEWQSAVKENFGHRELKFIHISKTGGGWIEDVGLKANLKWGRNHKEYGWWHRPFSLQKEGIKTKYDWFLVVRNPYTRIISEYHNVHAGDSMANSNWGRRKFNIHVRENIWNRSDFPGISGNHYCAQWKYVDTNSTTHIIHFENLMEEFEDLMRAYDLTQVLNYTKLDRVNVPKTKYFGVNDFDAHTIDLIRRVYRKDFEYFGYDMYHLPAT